MFKNFLQRFNEGKDKKYPREEGFSYEEMILRSEKLLNSYKKRIGEILSSSGKKYDFYRRLYEIGLEAFNEGKDICLDVSFEDYLVYFVEIILSGSDKLYIVADKNEVYMYGELLFYLLDEFLKNGKNIEVICLDEKILEIFKIFKNKYPNRVELYKLKENKKEEFYFDDIGKILTFFLSNKGYYRYSKNDNLDTKIPGGFVNFGDFEFADLLKKFFIRLKENSDSFNEKNVKIIVGFSSDK